MNRAWRKIVSAGFSCGLFAGVVPLACAVDMEAKSAAVATPVATSPPTASAAPAAKDAYVSAQLTKLLAGASVRVVLRRAFGNWLLVDVSGRDAKGGLADRPAPTFSLELFAFDNEAAARTKLQEELHSFRSPVALTRAGYDEFHSGDGGRLIGRRGAIVVEMSSSPPEGFDAVLAAIAKNVSADPALLPDLIHYAYTMHFGDIVRLHAVLAKLGAKVPELSVAFLGGPYGPNSVMANYTNTGGTILQIIAKSYDSETAAKAGQEEDQRGTSVRWDKTEIIQGVEVYEYTNYGGMDFQIGPHTINVRNGVQPLLLKVSSALIAELAPPAKPQSTPVRK